jgi:hypothetical protein
MTALGKGLNGVSCDFRPGEEAEEAAPRGEAIRKMRVKRCWHSRTKSANTRLPNPNQELWETNS